VHKAAPVSAPAAAGVNGTAGAVTAAASSGATVRVDKPAPKAGDDWEEF